MTDDRAEMKVARDAGLVKRHEQRLARAREGTEFPADGVERTAYLEGEPVTDMVIPPEAVKAAAKAIADRYEHTSAMYLTDATAALEAALPHLRPAACTCPTDADVTPDMRDETGQHLSGCPSGAKGLAAWMDEQIERIDETKALVETAAKLGRELGRREALKEIADGMGFESHFPDYVTVQLDLDTFGQLLAAREIAAKEPK